MREEYAAENHKHVSALLQGTKRVRRIMEDIEKSQKTEEKPMWKISKPFLPSFDLNSRSYV